MVFTIEGLQGMSELSFYHLTNDIGPFRLECDAEKREWLNDALHRYLDDLNDAWVVDGLKRQLSMAEDIEMGNFIIYAFLRDNDALENRLEFKFS